MIIKECVKRGLVLLLTMMLCLFAYAAEDAFVVEKIQIEGLQRIKLGTVLNYLPVTRGQTIQPEDSSKIIRALYKTGFFSNVILERHGEDLLIKVIERPTIGSIQVTGNSNISTKAMLDSFKAIGLAEGRVYDVSVLDNVKESLQNQYFDRGNYNAKVTTTVTPISQNRVTITIAINEGGSAKIKQIKIIGNEAYSESKLLGQFSLGESRAWSYFTKKDQYSREKLDADLEKLKSFYMDQGYINFKIDSTQVSLTPDKQNVYIIIHVTEGAQYHLKGFDVAGQIAVPKESVMKIIKLQPGEIFSRRNIAMTTTMIGNFLGDFGYAFASVQPMPVVDEETKTIFITFNVDSGKRFYVRYIYFVGNTKTMDKVLRREMRQMEGAESSLEKVRMSERRLNMLGYFKDVGVKTKPVPGTEDEIDLEFHVTEAPSATVSLSAGYSASQGLLINGGFDQPNFMGTGKTVGFNAEASYYVNSFGAFYFDPMITEDGIGMGVSLSATVTDYDRNNKGKLAPKNQKITSFNMDQYNVNWYFSLPIAEDNSVTAGIGYQVTDLTIKNHASLNLLAFRHRYGEHFQNILLSSGWSYVGLDRPVFPTKGFANFLNGTLAVPVTSESQTYYKANYSAYLYQPLFAGFILNLRGEIGYGNGLFDTDDLPFYENYFGGGIGVQGAVRGYKGYSLGPRDSQGNALGGNFLVDGSIGLIVPLPFAQDTLRTTVFVDAGNVFTDATLYVDPRFKCSGVDSGPIRIAAGIGAEWNSPFGPLVLSLASPLNKEHCDSRETFQFTISRRF